MITRGQKIRVIVFLVIIISLFGYLLFLLVGKKMLEKEDIYFIRLKKQSVTGLNIGQDVRYYGITIGKITEITINEKDISEIILTISVKSGTPLKNTTIAELNFLGITGLKVIELTGGENEDMDLNPGDFIIAKKGIISDITGKAEKITEKLEQFLNNINALTDEENRENIRLILDKSVDISEKVDVLLADLNDIVKENKSKVANVVSNFENLSIKANEIAENLNTFIAHGDSLFTSDEVTSIITELNNSLIKVNSKLLPEVEDLVVKFNLTTSHIDKTVMQSRKDIVNSMELLKETLENLSEFSRLIKDNPDILIKGKGE
ncbi:MAG: MCE family protein [Candidatus Delongbacteria bacterium]|nr:MCE family protein [Candidatus Delongbacteria bacterium]MBN2833755.1 MCE family protein [Candidatus Delongbacteria bacterium]